MIETVFDSATLPSADRFDHWCELMARTHAPMDMSSDHAFGFQAHQRMLRLGPVRVWPTTFQPMVFRRTPKLIRSSDPEIYHLSLLLRGRAQIAWEDHEAAFGPDDFHTSDSSRPYRIRAGTGGPITSVGVEIPKALLPLPRHRGDRVIGKPLSARDGHGALLAGFLTRLTAETGSYRACDGPRLGAVLIDLVAAYFAHVLDADRVLAPETRRRTLLLTLQAFIHRNLHDSSLDPRGVAAAHHISVSYLHRLFQAEGTTVAAWIRQRRLQRAHRDLADPALAAVPIHRIAARCGFAHAASFSRTFRTSYGVSPRDHRHQALHRRDCTSRGSAPVRR